VFPLRTPSPTRPSRRSLIPRREGAFWVLFTLLAPQGFGVVFTVLLRRVLGPGTSGLFDTAGVPYQFLDGFRSFGTGPAIVYQQEIDRPVANTAWTINMISAVITTLVAQIVAYPLALYFRHPAIEGIIRILSLAYLFGSAGSIHYFLLLRRLDFRARAVPALGQVAAGGIVALLFALWGFGVWTLVAREVASVAAGAALLWLIYPFRPRPQFIPDVARTLIRYGFWIGAGYTLLYLSQNVDVLIGARIIHRAADIGFYTTSWKLSFIIAGALASVSTSMVFPSLSRLRQDREALDAALLTALRQIATVALPTAALLAILAPSLVVPVLGPRWHAFRDAWPVLSILAIYAGNRSVLFTLFEGYKAIGRPSIIPYYHLVKLAIITPAVIVGAQHGILGLAAVYLPIQVLEVPAILILARRFLDIHLAAVWSALRVPLMTTVTMGAVTAGVEGLMRAQGISDATTLAVCLPLGLLLYAGVLHQLDPNIVGEARGVLLHGLAPGR